MEYQGVFVDDADDQYAQLLSLEGAVRISFIHVKDIADTAAEILKQKPSIVALDYRLDDQPQNLPASKTYKGSSLAQWLRDLKVDSPESDFAIVLVSAEKNIQNYFNPDRTAHDLFDRIYAKEEIAKKTDSVRAEFVGLCRAYETLIAANRQYDLFSLAKIEEPEFLDFQELRTAVGTAAAPHIVSRIFLKELIDKSGVLLDQNDVLARLGVDHQFSEIAITAVSSCAYAGLYGDAWPRWWEYKIERVLHGLFEANATSISSAKRAAILSKKVGKELLAAKSPWNDSTDELIAIACACCGRGTEIRHSVAAFEKALTRYSHRRRICWDCIQKDTCRDMKVDEADATLATSVKSKDRKQD